MPPVRIVVDTNVLVSRALTPAGPPARVVDAVLTGRLVACFDSRILREYEEVLARPRFGFAPSNAAHLLAYLTAEGLLFEPPAVTLRLPDESDRPFVEVAAAADAWLVTGNPGHFPGFARAISPAAFLTRTLPPPPA